MESLSYSEEFAQRSNSVTPVLLPSWNGGPLRYFASVAFANSTPYGSKIKRHAGAFVCALCKKAVAGVYKKEDVWVCASCRELKKPSRPLAIGTVKPMGIAVKQIAKPGPMPEYRQKRVLLIRRVKDR